MSATPEPSSWREWIASQSPQTLKAALNDLSPNALYALLYDWRTWARDKQLAPPGDWVHWVLLTGRGWGKTRTGAEWIRDRVESGKARRIHLVARTAADVRDTMVEGSSGILAISPPWDMPAYEPSKRRLTWPNGAIATTFTADEPNALRGPQCDTYWADEFASWRFVSDTWSNLMLGFRIGEDPRGIVTTTPKPVSELRKLIENPATVVTRGHTLENVANLTGPFREHIITRYEGTRLGRQELAGEMLEDAPGALWKRARIEELRVTSLPDLRRIVVAVDPSVTAKETSDECGILVAGAGEDGHYYVLDDRSDVMTVGEWAKQTVALYHGRNADRVVAEVNNGGDLVEQNIRQVDDLVSYKGVHASRGKQTRAEPVAHMYERGVVHHVGAFPELEDELCQWEPQSGARSPNRLDALVWALTELGLGDVPWWSQLGASSAEQEGKEN